MRFAPPHRAKIRLIGAAVLALSLGAGAGAAIAVPAAPTEAITSATFEWGINDAAQSASANGSCTYFGAGISDGSEETYRAEEGNVILIKRTVSGAAVKVTKQNRCLPLAGNDARQRALFTQGTGTTNPATGVTHVRWSGSFTIFAYGGLVPWHITNPELHIAADGTGKITAEVGGFKGDPGQPDKKTRLEPEQGVTILNLADVSVSGAAVNATPVFAGVDYFPLLDPDNPTSDRSGTSAISPAAKKATPDWGSWPQALVDFHYRTGLSTYWHSSGGSADSIKPPTAALISLDGGLPPFVEATRITVTDQPESIEAIPGQSARFSIAASAPTPLSYQWSQRVGTGEWEVIPGATTSELTLQNLRVEDASRLRVRVSSGDVFMDSAVATLEVAEPRPITANSYRWPDSTYFEGASVWITTGYSAYPSPQYTPQLSLDGGKTWESVGPTTSAPFYTADAAPLRWNGAKYRAVVSNGHHPEVLSYEVGIRVLPTPATPTVILDPAKFSPAHRFDPKVNADIDIIGSGFPLSASDVTFAVVPTLTWRLAAISTLRRTPSGRLPSRPIGSRGRGTSRARRGLRLARWIPEPPTPLSSLPPTQRIAPGTPRRR